VHKECWVFYEAEYENLRTLPGNESLNDLPATVNDAANAKNIAKAMGIEDKNIKLFNKSTVKSIQSTFREAMRVFMNHGQGDKRSFLMVYCAGHGVCDQMQYFVVDDIDHNLVPIEDKLRSLARGANVNVLAFYDICRSDKERFPNLKRGLDEIPSFAENYEYMHICTHPLQTVDAKSRLAELTIKQLGKKSRDENGLINIPAAF
jgi:hypothetical protein